MLPWNVCSSLVTPVMPDAAELGRFFTMRSYDSCRPSWMMPVTCVTSPPSALPQAGAETADEAHRIDAVADHQFARREALEVHAIHFVAGQAGHDAHEITS